MRAVLSSPPASAVFPSGDTAAACTAGHDPFAVRRERRVPRPAVDVPLLARLEPAARERDFLAPVGVDPLQLLAVGVPHPDRAVVARGQDARAVGGIPDPRDSPG